MKFRLVRARAAILVSFLGSLLILPAGAFAHPGQPFTNLAAYRAMGGDCSELFGPVIHFHDAQGNTYDGLNDACFSGAEVVWEGPAH